MHEQFGRYILLERIAIGGMAEIFKAKAPGLGGFEKILAIKRLHPRYSQDVDFIDMLIDEARITVQLNHSNIGQIFDLSKVEEDYFIAMEFIDGRDLYRVQKRLRDANQRMPLDAAAFIAMEACSGLDHAHRKRDSRNRPLRIVHRDVSPQNILASFEGDVKVVDFGIAKAQFRAYETEAGIIKGKFYYMSPEQARGESVDHRTDIFSLGIVLYEMVTGELLYKDDDDITLLSRVRRAEIEPAGRFRPELPDDFERIIMKALSRDREDRYPSAQHMQRDLAKYLRRSHSTFNKSRLGALMQQTFHEEFEGLDEGSLDSLRERSEFMEDEGSLISEIHFLDEPELTEQSDGTPSSDLMELPSDEFLLLDDSSEDFGGLRLPPLAATPVSARPPGQDRKLIEEDDFLDSAPTQAFDNALDNGDMGPGPNSLPPFQDDFKEPAVPVRGKPTVPIQASDSLGSESVMARRLRQNQNSGNEARFDHNATAMLSEDELPREPSVDIKPLLRRSRRHGVGPEIAAPSTIEGARVSAQKMKEWFGLGVGIVLVIALSMTVTSLLISDNKDEKTVGTSNALSEGTKATTGSAKNTATLAIRSEPSGAKVQVDGRWAFETTPTRVEVPIGRTVRIRIQQERYKREEREVLLRAGDVKELMVRLERLYGTLTVESSPSGATVYVDGNHLGRTPQTLSKLPLDRPTPLRLVKTGFRDYETLVKWPADESMLNKTIQAKLEPRRLDPPVKKKRASRAKTKKKRRRSSSRRGRSAPSARSSSSSKGFIKVIVKPWGQVFIDGRLVSEEGRLFNHPLAVGRHEVWACIRADRRECTPRRTVYLESGKSELLRFP